MVQFWRWTGNKAEELFKKFVFRDDSQIQIPAEGSPYQLRAEQEEAVSRTLAYVQSGKQPADFLWNAKPRFGKTLATYDFARKSGAKMSLLSRTALP